MEEDLVSKVGTTIEDMVHSSLNKAIMETMAKTHGAQAIALKRIVLTKAEVRDKSAMETRGGRFSGAYDRHLQEERGGYSSERDRYAEGSPFEGGPRQRSSHDPDYQQWRDEQLRNLDSDYESWRGERYKKFANDFNTWRSNRTQDSSNKTPQSGGANSSGSKSKDQS